MTEQISQRAAAQKPPFHSGYVAVIGRPNVGKSTLLNRLMGEKLSIVSDKPQTTRNTIHLIYTDARMQVIFLDTPGIQTPRNELGEYMWKLSRDSLDGVDCALVLMDESPTIGRLDALLLKELRNVPQVPLLLILNKMDRTTPEAMDALRRKFQDMGLFQDVLCLSAKTGVGVDAALDALYRMLPEGPQYYPEDMITDRTERFVVSEIIREKCLRNLQDEIPHGIFVGIDRMRERPGRPAADPLTDIDATIFCEKTSHKGMIIGKGGSMLRKIGSQARGDIETLLGQRVNLQLWVKVEKNWRRKKDKLKEFGYK